MMNEPKKFTRDKPVDKIALHNCFWDWELGRFAQRTLVNARTSIGVNVEKYMQKKGYAIVEEQHHALTNTRADVIRLTSAGQQWLTEGLQALLKNHPERRSEVNMLNRK